MPLEDQSRKPARLSGMIFVSSSSTLTSISSPSKPLMTTSLSFVGSIHGVFMVTVLSCGMSKNAGTMNTTVHTPANLHESPRFFSTQRDVDELRELFERDVDNHRRRSFRYDLSHLS